MKITKTEFKAIIKESLKELISEGALNGVLSQLISESGVAAYQGGNHQSQLMTQEADPRIKLLAASMGNKDARFGAVMEEVLNDTMYNTVPQHSAMAERAEAGVDLDGLQKYGVSFPTGPGSQQQLMSEQQPQHMANPQFVTPRNPLPPRDPGYQQPAMLNENRQSVNDGWVSPWQRLALGTPISNRPSPESASGLFGGGASNKGFLPGVSPGSQRARQNLDKKARFE